MIKAVILDVDGVIVGNQQGINFPTPHKEIIQALKRINAGGIPVILCTARNQTLIQNIIKHTKINNPHITHGGALIINILENKIIEKNVIDKNIVKEILLNLLQNNIYIELYTPNKYYVQKNQVSKFTDKRTNLLQAKPEVVPSLISIAGEKEIIKIVACEQKITEKSIIEKILKKINNEIDHVWSTNPHFKTAKFCIITAPNISKGQAAKKVLERLGLSFDTTLGIGDTSGDWNFMKLCKYAATLKNGDEEIIKLVKTKGEGNYYIAPHVDANGFLDILNYFAL